MSIVLYVVFTITIAILTFGWFKACDKYGGIK